MSISIQPLIPSKAPSEPRAVSCCLANSEPAVCGPGRGALKAALPAPPHRQEAEYFLATRGRWPHAEAQGRTPAEHGFRALRLSLALNPGPETLQRGDAEGSGLRSPERSRCLLSRRHCAGFDLAAIGGRWADHG